MELCTAVPRGGLSRRERPHPSRVECRIDRAIMYSQGEACGRSEASADATSKAVPQDCALSSTTCE